MLRRGAVSAAPSVGAAAVLLQLALVAVAAVGLLPAVAAELYLPELLTGGSGVTPPERRQPAARVADSGGRAGRAGQEESAAAAGEPAAETCPAALAAWVAARRAVKLLVNVPGALPPLELHRRLAGKHCAVVGNSGALLHPPFYGARIDEADVVVRFNQAPLEGYRKYVGSKVHVRLVNRLWTARYSYSRYGGVTSRRFADELPREAGVVFLASRTEPEVFEKLLRTLHDEHAATRTQAVRLRSTVIKLGADYLHAFRQCRLRLAGPAQRRYDGGTAPSSGVLALTVLLGLCRTVTTYGVGGAWGAATPYQYYQFMRTEREHGNPTHSFGAEQALVHNLAHLGVLKQCTRQGCFMGRPPALVERLLRQARNDSLAAFSLHDNSAPDHAAGLLHLAADAE